MRVKELEHRLSNLADFERPKIELEQYMTRPHIAAQVVNYAAAEFDEIEDRMVVDLGCGGGALSAAALYCGAGAVLGVEIDPAAIVVNLANRALPDFEDSQWDVIQADVTDMPHLQSDIVLTNPPFGTKNNAGIDFDFLSAAQKIATEAIYSLHKTSCRDGLKRKTKKIGLEGEVIAELSFDLPKTYRFHKKAMAHINVDLWRFEI